MRNSLWDTIPATDGRPGKRFFAQSGQQECFQVLVLRQENAIIFLILHLVQGPLRLLHIYYDLNMSEEEMVDWLTENISTPWR